MDEGSIDPTSQHGVDHLTLPVPYSTVDLNESSDPARSEMSETRSSMPGALSSLAVRNPSGAEAGGDAEANSGIMRKRRTDIARQVEEMQRRVALLRSQSTAGIAGSRSGMASDAPSESITGSSDSEAAELRSHIANLEAEVERLQAQQEYYQQIGLGDEPPPQYAESVEPTGSMAHEAGRTLPSRP